MYGLNKYMIDINIETLAGTTFSLKVSPLEPIQSVKAKIQRLEGIPISHQHLVWKTTELDDSCCLNDYNVPNGATIKMVLALRGGPINTRRMTTEDSLLRDVSDLMEIREDSNLWNNNDSSQSMNKHVTLLLFRDGDHLNLLRVIDRGDAASPISGAMSAASMYVPYDDTDHDRVGTNNPDDLNILENDLTNKLSSKLSTKSSKTSKKSLTNENEKTREKMMALRDRMNEYKKSKAKKKQSPTPNLITSSTINSLNDNNNNNTHNNINATTSSETAANTFTNDLNSQPHTQNVNSEPSNNPANESTKIVKSNTASANLSTNNIIEDQLQPQQQPPLPPLHNSDKNNKQQGQLPLAASNINNINNLRMKRFQIIGANTCSDSNTQILNKRESTTNKNVTPSEKQNHNKSNENISQEPNNNKTKMTTIYTTTDRNGQVFIKRIQNYSTEYDDEEDDDGTALVNNEEEEADYDDDEESDVEEQDEEENYDEECPEYENNLFKNYNCYYEDEDDVDDDEDDEDDEEEDDDDDDETDEDEEEDEECDDEDKDEVDRGIFRNQNNRSSYSQNKAKSEYDNVSDGVNMYGEEDNYDEEENELYDNKSELLIAEDRQTNNSPNSGAAAVSGVVGGTRSSDLMNMMMMTLNSGGDQMSLNGGAASGVGVSSSLATTALPTIITPLYTTDNENFVIPPTRHSEIKKMKTIRGVNKKNCYSNQIKSKQPNRKLKSLSKISNILDVIQIEAKNQIISAAAASDSNKEQCIEIEKLKQLESVIQEERLKRQIQKQQKRRKQRQLQLQLQMQQQQKIENETKTPSEIAAVAVGTSETTLEKNQLESEQAMMIRRNQRRRRCRDSQIDVAQLPPANISFSSILLLPEEIETLKKRVKEGNAIKHQQQQNRQLKNPTKITSEPSIELAASVPTNCDENKAKCPPYVDDTADQEAIKTSMPSTILQKRVSFIMTPTDEDSAKNMLVNTNSSEITDENTKAKLNNSLLDNLYYNHEKMKKILKATHQNITNSPSRNSLQAKVFKSYDGDQSAMKPLLLSNYKQKPPPKLDSLYTANELITLSNTNVNKNIYATQQQQQQQHHHQQDILSNNKIYTSSNTATANNNNMMISTDESEYNSENKSKLIKSNQFSNELASNLINSTQSRIQPQIREQSNILMKRNSAALRNVSTPTSSPTSTAINRLDILKTNSSYAGSSLIKSYPNQLTYSSNIRINSKPNETTTSTTIEPLRLYSASSKPNKPTMSISSNDLAQTKSLKLPPVINSNSNSASHSGAGTNIIIGGSTNNLTSIGLNETTGKKKITDLSRYCYFCQRKTGLASSYICRCGNNYCTQHRNAEAHNCTYDYKTEGRKLIEHSNPLVAAPKLPKI